MPFPLQLLILLLFLQSMMSLQTVANLSVYTYPASESDPAAFYNNLRKEVWVPKNIIFKIMDVDSLGTIYPKIPISQIMLSSFPAASFNHFFMINIATKALLPVSKANDILSSIQSILKQLKTAPLGFVIDAEPIIDPSDPSYNTLGFHTELISLINSKLNLPLAVYFNPSILANPEVNIKEQPGFNELISQLRSNRQNLIQLAIYPGLRDDRIADSIKLLEAEGVQYELVADMSDLGVLQTRMQTVKQEKLSRNGLVLYNLGSGNPKFPAGSMQIIKDAYQ